MRSTSPVGSLPASGSCESRRMVVSTIWGMSRVDLTVAAARAGEDAAASRHDAASARLSPPSYAREM